MTTTTKFLLYTGHCSYSLLVNHFYQLLKHDDINNNKSFCCIQDTVVVLCQDWDRALTCEQWPALIE